VLKVQQDSQQPGSGLLVDYSQGTLQDYGTASNVGSGVEVIDGDNLILRGRRINRGGYVGGIDLRAWPECGGG
jgi:hypothetical protein